MLESFYIEKFCKIHKQQIAVDSQIVWRDEESPFSEFVKNSFRNLQVEYPKFYKMDPLSKLALLASEYLLKDSSDSNIAIVLANQSGSMDSDVKHMHSIRDPESFFPSPATFVYTLANICAGEISIRHNLQTENVFFVDDQYPTDLIYAYTSYLLQSNRARKVLCGWVEYFQENYKVVLYLVGRDGTQIHSVKNIEVLF
ncbi:3-oxoacyl-ACP synthase [Sphingobacterium shayense]|uniref:3-oxoacyl-ACP synthase n=1 Tax=Sphingobacterium shayense TaxID=626343 RepID=UPI0015562922|nr:3-oxoacyl-ACP synthase [Sphingobacterium shayense]NQD69200.1 3-oxoacyl-ACP synthase [Sphingobacterium shayense]